MFHRIINWITNPFKKQSENQLVSTEEALELSTETKNQLRAELIQTIKSVKEKKEKEEIVELAPETAVYPITEEVVVSTKTKKKRYYKKKAKKNNNNEAPKETAAIKPTPKKSSK